jgi:hypothetical protein
LFFAIGISLKIFYLKAYDMARHRCKLASREG